MGNLIAGWVVNHQQYLLGIASGWALANIPKVVAIAFHYAMQVPWLRAAVVANPEQAKAIVAQIAAELDKDIDAEAAPAPIAPTELPKA